MLAAARRRRTPPTNNSSDGHANAGGPCTRAMPTTAPPVRRADERVLHGQRPRRRAVVFESTDSFLEVWDGRHPAGDHAGRHKPDPRVRVRRQARRRHAEHGHLRRQPLTLLTARDQNSVHLEIRYLLNPPAGTAALAWTKRAPARTSPGVTAIYQRVSLNQATAFGSAVQNGQTADGAGARASPSRANRRTRPRRRRVQRSHSRPPPPDAARGPEARWSPTFDHRGRLLRQARRSRRQR